MKLISGLSAMLLIFTASFSQAGVVVGGTRLIYDGAKKESSLNISNPDKEPYLIQSWIETTGGGVEKAPFIITPPLFRLDGEQNNVLRIVQVGANLAPDRESLYWLNIKSIPSSTKVEGRNTLQVAVKTRIKLIYRPKTLTGLPEDMAQTLKWQRHGNQLQVTNSTPFYMNFQQVSIGGKEVDSATYVAPNSSAKFSLPVNITGNQIQWKIISDYGGIGEQHTAVL